MEARLAGVSMIEGATALTQMPSLATSPASAWVKAATALAAALHRLDRTGAAQLAGEQVHLDHGQEIGLAALGRRLHGEAAGQMDRRPQRARAGIEPGDGGLVGQLGRPDQLHPGVALERKALSLAGLDIRHAAAGPGIEQGLHHGPAQRAGTAGDDNLAAAIIAHEPRLYESRRPVMTAAPVLLQSARGAALALLEAVLGRKIPLDQALAESKPMAALAARDRAFPRLLAAPVLRRLGQVGDVLA